MTGFCGAFARTAPANGAIENDHQLKVAKKTLSRSDSVIQFYQDSRAFIVFFDNAAFEPNRLLVRTEDAVACVSGDPLLVGDDSVTNDPADGANRICVALIGDRDDVLSRAAGNYVAVSWNSRTSTLKFCADKLSLRPLYLYLDEERCVFATNLRTLRVLVDRPLEIDEQGLAELFYADQNFGNHTQYKNVRVLRPGEVLTIGILGEVSQRYFNWNAIHERAADEGTVRSDLYDAFIRAIRRRSRHGTEDAYLSGGLDSRCVVAGLLDAGRSVRTFGNSYEGSADDVIGRSVAATFGTEHHVNIRLPSDYLTSGDCHEMYAKEKFPSPDTRPGKGRVIWSGDGGSVGMGHVYLDEIKMELGSASVSDEAIYRVLPQLERRGTRILDGKTDRRMRWLAIVGVRKELESIAPKNTGRRLFLFYLLNDQMRHLYRHFEDIDLHAVEFAMPFFDMDFLSLVVASPVGMFLRHRLYNRWLSCFKTPAASVPWQAYPGHEAGHLPLPAGIRSQWSNDWYRGAATRLLADRVATRILVERDARVSTYISRRVICILKLLNRVGIERYNYELWRARKVYEYIKGESIGG